MDFLELVQELCKAVCAHVQGYTRSPGLGANLLLSGPDGAFFIFYV